MINPFVNGLCLHVVILIILDCLDASKLSKHGCLRHTHKDFQAKGSQSILCFPGMKWNNQECINFRVCLYVYVITVIAENFQATYFCELNFCCNLLFMVPRGREKRNLENKQACTVNWSHSAKNPNVKKLR